MYIYILRYTDRKIIGWRFTHSTQTRTSTVLSIMRLFSSIVLSLSILVVFAVRTHDAHGDGHYPTIRDRATTTLVADGPFFRPNARVAVVTAAKTTPPFNDAVLDVPNNNEILIRQPQRGGATKPAAGTTTTNGLPKALAGAIVFAMIEKLVKATLKQLNIAYPAQLGACIVLFIVLCLTDALISPSVASDIFTFLTPGAALLAKWFPIFFIPGLVLLPLSPPIGGTTDVRTIRNRRPCIVVGHMNDMRPLTFSFPCRF